MNYFVKRMRDFWEGLICARQNRFVTVSDIALENAAREFSLQEPQAPDWLIPNLLPRSNRAFVSQLLYLSGINAAGTHFVTPWPKYKVEQYEGSEALTRCFYRRFGEKPVRAEEIMDMTDSPKKTREFFQGENLPPLLENRAPHLREIAQIMYNGFDDEPLNLLEQANFLAVNPDDDWGLGAVELLANLCPVAFGQDKHPVRKDLIFYKRPQLFVLMYQGRAMHSGGELPLIKTPHRIGPISDYRVPNTLRHRQIFFYSPDLAEKIDQREEIPRHSKEELEIRIGTVYAVAELLNRINNYRLSRNAKPWTIIELDYPLWKAGRNVPHPHHLCRTTDY